MIGMTYLKVVPINVPDGVRLVHNFPPGTPRRRFGVDGFRFWLEHDEPNERRSPCGCKWEAPAHWTVLR